jgi:hypothetical protein
MLLPPVDLRPTTPILPLGEIRNASGGLWERYLPQVDSDYARTWDDHAVGWNYRAMQEESLKQLPPQEPLY